MRTIFLALSIISFVSTRFFDVCPGRRQSIGACLVGLCPAGSECINSYCCKFKKSTTTPSDLIEMEVDEVSEFGTCASGERSIGECISEACPLGYKCEKGYCCVRKEEEIPMKSSPISLITTPPEDSQENIMSEESETTKQVTSEESTTTSDRDIDEVEIDEEVEEEEETTTTTKATTTTKKPTKASRKAKKPKTRAPTTIKTTTTPEPETTIETTTEYITTTTTAEEREEITNPTEEVTEPNFVCPVGAPIGECIANKCPEGHSCLEGQCCILTPQINCTDELAGCLSHLCDRKGYRQFMTNNCAKTCARCHLINITSNEIRDCRDRRSDCEEWAAEGFCESSLYTTRQKLKFCGKSCKLC
ncbi:unnamed protein product [Caenorhabditis bovis]|uniref:ShKT domain-containing protein n=1 Tax=Caenorhabditis bovis TaxID=2654633 RepID=A0A8S1EMR7_9PELO|nr:unnamed protein product [Caenorhabditis bovis]